MRRKSIRFITAVILCLFSTGDLYAQYNVKLISVTHPQRKDAALRFGDIMNIKLEYQLDSQFKNDQALTYLKNYYLIINGIPYPEKKIQDMEIVSNKVGTPDKSAANLRLCFITYQSRLPEAYEDTNGTNVLSKFWKQHYRPLYNQHNIYVGLLSARPDDQLISSVKTKLRFYEKWRVVIFVIAFGALLCFILWKSSRDNFTLLRDDSGCTDNQYKHPYSLSRVQVFFWTFTIFGMIAYVWAVTDFLPTLTAAHLVLLGIAAGQRILAQIIDSKLPRKNTTETASLTRNPAGSTTIVTAGCSVNFFTDIISDKSGLSITRLQYFITTFVFLVVFITTAIQKLELVDISIEQLALMGTSAGLYLWNKKLDQQANPPSNQ